MGRHNTPAEEAQQPGLADRIRDLIDRAGEWLEDLLAPPPVLIPIPVRESPRDYPPRR